uniref:3'-5' exonuclease domain-containing protein n=1 Tax=Strongyloides venezuelensis TaxID=75913 RepID=A0A0K0FMZ1_STRVS
MSLGINIFKKNVRNRVIQLCRQQHSDIKFPLQRGFNWLRYTIKMRYVENKVDSYFLNDVAYRVICQHPSLKCFYEHSLKKVEDLEEAKRWKSIHIGSDKYPRFFPFEDNPNDDLYVGKSDYLSMPRTTSVKICLKDDEIQKVAATIKCANESGFNVVGFDCEWPPYFDSKYISLIQIALDNQCFLVDASYGNKKLIGELLDELFSAKNLIKLGKSPIDDVNKLLDAYPDVKALREPKNVLCLSKLIITFNNPSGYNCSGNIDSVLPHWKMFFNKFNHKNVSSISTLCNSDLTSDFGKIVKGNEFSKEKSTEKQQLIKEFKYVMENAGLSRLSKLVLGKELDKSEQISIWDRRPLRTSQIRYAALDAEVSRMIYFKLEEWCKQLNIDIKEITIKSISVKDKKKSKN